MKEGKWLKKELKRTELMGKTLGLIGCGRIGVEVAKRALAFGMKVIGYDPVVTKSDYIELKPSLDAMLPLCDYISLHTPVNDQTKGMINKNTIAKMKKGVVFINTGRGKCIIEQDVVDALKSGQMAAYATDVWYSDPPAEDCASVQGAQHADGSAYRRFQQRKSAAYRQTGRSDYRRIRRRQVIVTRRGCERIIGNVGTTLAVVL